MPAKPNKFDYVRTKNPAIRRGKPCIVSGTLCNVSSVHAGSVVLRREIIAHPTDVQCELTPQDNQALALIDQLVLRADELLIHEILVGSGFEAYSDEAYAVRRRAEGIIRTLLRNYRTLPLQEKP